MKKSTVFCITLVTAIFLVLTGCGGGSAGYATKSEAARESYAYSDDIYAYEEAAYEDVMVTDGGVETPKVMDTRKLIKNVSMEVETENFDELLGKLNGRIVSLGGYVENSYTYNGTTYSGKSMRSASIVARIPAENLDIFLNQISENSNVVSKNESVTDVTLTYVDMESHKSALQSEEKRLEELMEEADSVEDLITIESRLSDVRYQIESMESQLRTYDNLVTYSTVSIEISEVTVFTPTEEPGRLEKIGTGFVDSLKRVGNGFLDFFTGIIIALPYLVIWGVIIFVIYLFIKRSVRKHKAKKMERQKAYAKMYNAQMMTVNGAGSIQENCEEKQPSEEKVQADEKGSESAKESL